jgi:hypothetical protein
VFSKVTDRRCHKHRNEVCKFHKKQILTQFTVSEPDFQSTDGWQTSKEMHKVKHQTHDCHQSLCRDQRQTWFLKVWTIGSVDSWSWFSIRSSPFSNVGCWNLELNSLMADKPPWNTQSEPSKSWWLSNYSQRPMSHAILKSMDSRFSWKLVMIQFQEHCPFVDVGFWNLKLNPLMADKPPGKKHEASDSWLLSNYLQRPMSHAILKSVDRMFS